MTDTEKKETTEGQKYTLLLVDDDPAIHMMFGTLLKDEYHILDADNVQEAVDLLAENPVHFILSDIHMDGMTGIEFLESLTKDEGKKEIPFLLMTSLPSTEKERKAMGLGAVDFIDKALFYENLEAVAERIRMKFVADIDDAGLPEELRLSRKEITRRLMFEVSNGDYLSSCQVLFRSLLNQLSLDHLSFWMMWDDRVQMVLAHGIQPPATYGPEMFEKEPNYEALKNNRRPYLTNHVFSEGDEGILKELSEEEGMPAEIGVPLFALTEKELIKNKMKIPPNAELFGYVFLKRKKMFTSKEYRLVSVMLMQLGTMLWRLFDEM